MARLSERQARHFLLFEQIQFLIMAPRFYLAQMYSDLKNLIVQKKQTIVLDIIWIVFRTKSMLNKKEDANMKYNDLHGKTAIVTGAAQGLSLGMAEGLMEAGAAVCLVDLNEKVMETAEKKRSQGYACYSAVINLTEQEQRIQGFAKAVELLGGHLDILVNGAGVQKRHKSEEFPAQDWDFVLDVNLNAVFYLCQLAGKQFIKQKTGGKIINIASMLSFFGGYTVPAYAASKGAVAQLTKALCNEWAEKGINVNALAPGYMATAMNTELTNPENPRYKEITDRIPAGRWGLPEDMKGPLVWLASDASNYINGAIIPVDGGYLVR